MKQIYLSRYHSRIIYTVREYNRAGKLLWEKRYDCVTTEHIVNGEKYIILRDCDGHVRIAPFIYLNRKRRGRVDSTRRMTGEAIQEYETFCDIFGYDSSALPEQGYEMFKRFLFRTDILPLEGYEKNFTLNSVAHVKSFIGSVTKYLECMGYDTRAFKRENAGFREEMAAGGHVQVVHGNQGDPDLRDNPQKKFKAPEHLKPAEIRKLFEMIDKRGDILMRAVCLLGFSLGLRRGEILGLTQEDIVETADPATGEVRHMLIVRNRISDRNDQRSKTLRKPRYKSAYGAKDFQLSRYEIMISETVYNAVNEYYQKSRNVDDEDRKVIDEVSRADSFEGSKNNHYIFIGRSKGTSKDRNGIDRQVKWNVLSGDVLNDLIDAYFKTGGWKLRNKCHAMRHSFAMFHAYYRQHPLKHEQLAALLRHASLGSTAAYFNLPEDEKQKLMMLHSAEMEKLILGGPDNDL